MIRVEGVTKRFGDVQALDDVSIWAEPGEVLGLLGPNGAGKTTLVRILATLLRPDAGQVHVGGHDLAADPGAVRSLIGLAGQLAAVDEILTGRENLELIGRLYGLRGDERRQRTETVLRQVDLLDAADRLVRTYSGGMRRRLDLAATLVGRPSVLLLDEPTTGLDPRSRGEIWRQVQELAASGATVVLTSQHMDEVEHLADRIVVLDEGRVIAVGTPDDLKRQIGGDVLEARVADEADLLVARDVLVACGDGPTQVEPEQRRVTVPTRTSVAALVAAGQRLEEADVRLDDLGIRRPSLDDVFFALTGGGQAPVAVVSPPPSAREVPLPIDRRRTGVSDAMAITVRALRFVLRTPQLLFFGLVQPVVFLVTLGPIFGTVVEAVADVDYAQYLLPGVLVMTTVLNAGSTGIALAVDLQAGIIDRFRSLPMARHALLVGRTLADLVRNAAAMVLVVLVGMWMGFRFHGGPLRGAAALGLALLFGYALTWVFAAVGLAVKDVQTAQFLGFAPVLPFVFLSGSWIPVVAMDGALQTFARNQPVNVVLEAVRSLVDEGGDPGRWVVLSLLWSAAILAVFSTVAVRTYARSAKA